MTLSRRHFIRNLSIAGSGLTLGLSLSACSGSSPLPSSEGEFQPNAFLRVNSDGRVIMTLPKAEMGQGVMTGMATLVAEELHVQPGDISVEFAPVHEAYRDPEMFLQITGGSASIRVYYTVLREAGAEARYRLLAAAAHLWGTPVEQLQAVDGVVRSSDGRFEAHYGELASLASSMPAPSEVALKAPEDFTLIGHYEQRLDAQSKSDGSAIFGIDAGPEDSLVAVLVRSPVIGGQLVDFDASSASKLTGVVDIFAIEQGVAVVAQGYWYARRAADALKANFETPESTLGSSEGITATLLAALDDGDFAGLRDEPASGEAAGVLEVAAEYQVPFLAHATMEPQNATVVLTNDHCDVWVGSQSPDVARDAAARAAGLDREQVTVHNQLLGGGFGRRASADNVVEAVAIARHVKRPVKLIWSREDDTRNDFYRPAMVGRLSARVAKDGSVSHYRHDLAGPSLSQQVFPQFGAAVLPSWVPGALPALAGNLMATRDSFAVEGASDLPYQFDGIEVRYCNVQTPLPLGYWRSVGHSHTGFVVESFVDELAHAAGVDPVQFRRDTLPPQSRHRGVLDRVAKMAAWAEPGQPGTRGVAVHESFGTVAAQIAQISLQGGQWRVEKVWCAVDCGQVVNPDIVKDQLIGGIVFGLTAALYGQITLRDGAIEQSNFHDYPLLRHGETPEIEVQIMPSENPPSGVGEPGTPPIAAAVANAVFAATGERLRELPLKTV